MRDAPSDQTVDPKPTDSADGYAMRSEPRLESDGLHCSLGRVADITGSGMRMIVSPQDLPQVGDVQSYTFADFKDEITITGSVKWVRKPTLFTRRGEVGIEFAKLDPLTREAIIRLAVHGGLDLNKDRDIKVSYPDLYKFLGISRYANTDQLKEAYRKNAKAWHPDVNSDPKAAQYFEEIQRAYAVLSNEQSRTNFDLKFFGPDLNPEDTFGGQANNQADSEAA